MDFNEFSNPAPVYFSLKTNYVPRVNCTGENSFHRWEQEYTSVFRDRISCGIGNLENILKNKIRDNCESNVLVYEFTNFLQACGDDLTRKTIKSKGNSFVNTDENRKEWFDRECQNKRKEYKEAIYEFNAQRNDDTRSKMLCKKREYRKTCKQHKLQFNRMLCLEMNDIRSKQPKRFWKMFKKKGADKSCNVSIYDFFVHFKNLAQSVETDENIDFVNFVNDFESQPNKNVTFDELDSKITKEEITIACKSLRDNKACSIDNILYEYFKVSSDILVDALELLFNYILDTGDFPSYWTRCIIVPIHKKGNTSDPNNYRGISLVSCFAKLFNTILNKRLKEWADTNDKVTDAQFGFKANYSTVDAIFILNHFIQENIRTKGKLFCCFVDFRKAYDLINRNCLWYKLIKDGIDGKMFNMLRSMYKEIKLGVKHLNNVSDFFDSNIGLLQGEITSPILFSFFINDLETHLQSNIDAGLTLDELSIFLLLFADDAVLMSESKDGLQLSLRELESYCIKWNLHVNADKTKIVIFRKGGIVNRNYRWYYEGKEIEIVNCFNYLVEDHL